jgi:hypothetical protein
MECIGKILCTWIEDCNQCRAPVSEVLVQAKAHFVYENLLKHDGKAKPFNASSGLL